MKATVIYLGEKDFIRPSSKLLGSPYLLRMANSMAYFLNKGRILTNTYHCVSLQRLFRPFDVSTWIFRNKNKTTKYFHQEIPESNTSYNCNILKCISKVHIFNASPKESETSSTEFACTSRLRRLPVLVSNNVVNILGEGYCRQKCANTARSLL